MVTKEQLKNNRLLDLKTKKIKTKLTNQNKPLKLNLVTEIKISKRNTIISIRSL